MVVIIVISFFVLIGAAFSLYLWQRPALDENADSDLPPRSLAGLFEQDSVGEELAQPQDATSATSRQAELMERAGSGDRQTLSEAHAAGNAGLYGDVLNALVESIADRQENFRALVSHISKSTELRANKALAERVMQSWKTAPDRRSTAEMIHIAALSDDAETYERAVEAALEFWRSGSLPGFTPEELVELFVSQYWVIAPEARRGGVGFALKRRLLGVRRELATATPAR